MKVDKILYHPEFVREFKSLPSNLQKRAINAEKRFKDNPLHPSLRLYGLKGQLKGSWSISITLKVRILFTRLENGDIVFYSIGFHDIYQSL